MIERQVRSACGTGVANVGAGLEGRAGFRVPSGPHALLAPAPVRGDGAKLGVSGLGIVRRPPPLALPGERTPASSAARISSARMRDAAAGRFGEDM